MVLDTIDTHYCCTVLNYTVLYTHPMQGRVGQGLKQHGARSVGVLASWSIYTMYSNYVYACMVGWLVAGSIIRACLQGILHVTVIIVVSLPLCLAHDRDQ